MDKNNLFKLLNTEEVKNNPELHNELHTLWKNTYYTIQVWNLSDLSINTLKYLLNNGITAAELLNAGLNLSPGKEKRDQLIDLALNHEVDWDRLSSYDLTSISTTEAEKFLNHGLNAKLILKIAFNQRSEEKRDQLIDLALKHEVDWNSFSYYDLTSISTIEAEKLLNHGASAKLILETAFYQDSGEKRDQLVELALKHEVDWDRLSSYDLTSISTTEAEKLLNHGLNAKLILETALCKESGEKRDQLVELALNHKIDWNGLSYYNLKSISTIEAEKLLNHGASAKLILETALYKESGEKRDQLVELALNHKIDWNGLSYYNLKSISTIEAEKLLNHGASPKLILETALYQDSGEKRDQLVELALKHEVDWDRLSYYDLTSISTIEAEKLLNHGASAKLILETAFYQEAGERRDQLIDLALNHEIDWNNLSSYSIKSFSIMEAKKLLDKGVSGKLILETALEQEAGEERDQLIDLSLNNEIDWNNLYSYSIKSLSIMEAKKLLDKGAGGKLILETAIRQETGENSDQLIELALTKKIDWNNFYFLDSTSKNQLELLLNNGLPLSKALSSLLSTNYSYTETVSKEVQHQIELIEFLVEKGASFRGVYSIPSYFPYETYQFLLEHGLSAHHVFSKVFEIELGERHNQLLDLALRHKPNLNKIGHIGSNISKTDLDKIIDSGLNPIKILELTSSDHFIELFDYLIEKGIDISSLQRTPDDLSYEQYQEVLKHGINPDVLIQTAGYSLSRNSLFGNDNGIKEKSIEIIKLALDHGADINADYGNGSLLSATMDTEVLDFLVERGAKCSNRSFDEILENGLSNILFNPQSTIDQKFKNLDAPKAEEAKIPYILHQIWLTSPDSPKEIREQDLKISLETHETFAKAPVQWQQIIWTNDKTLFPKTVKVLEDNGIQVKSIYEHQDELASFEMIENLIAQQKWGMASDALRYVLVNEFGGVYADLNFNFHRHTTDEAHKYNYFTQEFGGYYIDNFFFGASPNHPIIQKIVGMVERNIVNPPEYIANIKDQSSPVITDMSTANPTFIAYYLEANKDGNIDVVYPKGAYPNRDGFYEPMSYQSMDNNPEIREGSERYKEITEKYCPDSIWMMNLGNHPHPFDNICVAEIFIIGEDSTDGRTWVSE